MWETVKSLNQKWVSHLGERSSIKMNEEHGLEHATGDSAGALPVASESEDKPLLTLLPSKISEHELKSDNCVASVDSMLVAPWNGLLGWLSISISPFLLRGPRTLGLMHLTGLWLLLEKCLGLGTELGGTSLLPTNICKDGDVHFPNPLVGEGAGETGVKSILFGEYNFSGLSKSLSLRLKLSSHEWLICIPPCGSLSFAVSLFIKSRPSSKLWWLITVALFLPVLSGYGSKTWERSLSTWIRGALLDRLRVPPSDVSASKSSSIFSWAIRRLASQHSRQCSQLLVLCYGLTAGLSCWGLAAGGGG